MRRTLLLCAITLVLAAAPAAGQSAVFSAGHAAQGIGGPSFGGDGLIWAEVGSDLGVRLLTANPGIPQPHVLATVPALPRTTLTSTWTRASSSRVLLSAQFDNCSGCDRYNFARFLGLSVLAGTTDALHEIGAAGDRQYAEVVGDHLVYAAEEAGRRVIRFEDPVTGERIDVPTVAYRSTFRVAGAMLAHRDDAGPVVVEWRSGREVYRPELPEDWRDAELLAFQADGKAVWSSDAGRRHGLTTPAAPAIRTMPLRPSLPSGSLFAGDRILKMFDDARVMDLEGRDVAVLPDAEGRGRFVGDFDGQRVAWAERPCAVPQIAVWDIDSGPAPRVPAPLCHGPTLLGRPTGFRNGKVRVKLRCDADPIAGCPGVVRATIRPDRGRRATGHAFVTMDAGEVRTVQLRSRLPRRLRRGWLQVQVVTTTTHRVAPHGSHVKDFRFRVRR